MAASRARALEQIFNDILQGTRVLSRFNATQFLEAIYTRPTPVACIEKITASPHGIKAIQSALYTQLDSATFFNNHVALFLTYLDRPELQLVNNGQYLNDIVVQICEPPLFWNSFLRAFSTGKLEDDAKAALGWLLLQLCSLPSDTARPYQEHPDTRLIVDALIAPSASTSMHSVGQKLNALLDTNTSLANLNQSVGSGPGGRHDNDFEDFRQISILPTAEEIASTEPPFLRPAHVLDDPSTQDARVTIHLDNQFRLLREDMLYELREELQSHLGMKKRGPSRGIKIKDLFVEDVDCGEERKWTACRFVVICNSDIPRLDKHQAPAERKNFLKEHPRFLKHQSLACLVSGTEVIAFATIIRDEEKLSKNPPRLLLQFDGSVATERALQRLKTDDKVCLVQIDTAVFAYEPVLKRLQATKNLALASELLLWDNDSPVGQLPPQAATLVDALRARSDANLKPLLGTTTDIKLDPSQAVSLLAGLTQQVSVLQGPPGTGKSFIGALLAKALFDFSSKTILVVCFTNHALDDILESLLKIGIPEREMLRLGNKSTSATESLLLQHQPRSGRGQDQWAIIDQCKSRLDNLYQQLRRSFNKYNADRIDFREIFGYIEFASEVVFAALKVPRLEDEDGMKHVDHIGRAIDGLYLLKRWQRGLDAGIFVDDIQDEELQAVWAMTKAERARLWSDWEKAILDVDIQDFRKDMTEFNTVQTELMKAQSANIFPILKSKRVLGCTTTAAAKYSDEIQVFNPDVLLVEEAGEILESHVLMSMGPQTSQVILIGDHKQLRPKVNNYLLTVEKGEGFDLNRSLFERLILKEYPHSTLTQQHRMRPEISAFVRALTYPDLLDATSTKTRPDIRGVQNNVIFFHHEYPEGDDAVADRHDLSANSSKHNNFEVQMVLKIVKYLGQQGYGTNDLVILTPYLGQLSKLRQALKKDNDPILNDLDSFDLVRAGLLTQAEASFTKKPIRLATIDNYQGEESDIVIISLTRSNARRDIGFMFSPERLNVLLSRSRNGLIMIGNITTFRESRKGRDLWTQFFDLLHHGKHIYEGFPVRCERHPDKTNILSKAEEFDALCPDGGCNLPCGVLLPCGNHGCRSKCHVLSDHSQVKCDESLSHKCAVGHVLAYKCSDGPPGVCPKCEREIRLAKQKQEEAERETQRREEEEREHLRRMDELEAQITAVYRAREGTRLAGERRNAIRQKERDLENALALNQPVNNTSTSTASPQQSTGRSTNAAFDTTPLPAPSQDGHDPSPENTGHSDLASTTATAQTSQAANPQPRLPRPPSKPFPTLASSLSKAEWERQKTTFGVTNASVDAIMALTGLEDIKAHILTLLAKIDVSKRQGASLKKERFNAVLLGNPGTGKSIIVDILCRRIMGSPFAVGKTTVARHFAQMLASINVVPSAVFEETTGARLAHEGVDGTKQILDKVLKAGGGTIFIDEAYQLASGHNFQGGAVLDFLLAEMENHVGTLVFLLAGYNREMERFFEHNPGLKSRVPITFQFADYKDEELMAMFEGLLRSIYGGRMRVEDGTQGLYSRILVRRLGRRRAQPGFGNARDLQTLFARVGDRQAKRLSAARHRGDMVDDFFMVGEDLIGPEPSQAILLSQAWKDLQKLIGLQSVKSSVVALIDIIKENYQRELIEKEPLAVSLNRVFLGSPGTGKTTVAKLYGQILADLGLLSNGDVVAKNPSDFVGAHLGQSEAQTKAILANSVGKVLIIDEAYMLYGGGGEGAGSNNNQFKTSVIDTIVAEVQNVPGEDRCVLMLGYKAQMEEMFQNVNPGLSRRFKIEDAFNFEDFDDAQLLQILEHKLHNQDLDATEGAKQVAIEVLSRMRNRPNFGNAGEVENLITSAKQRCVARRSQMPMHLRGIDIVFDPEDFDPDFNRIATASNNLDTLFQDIIGHQDTKQRLANYQEIAQTCKMRGLDIRQRVPTNFVFTGPPGTGKTTIARKMGHVFYDMGLLSSSGVVECSASDLVAQYVGQTGPKTRKLFEKAVGKVLFIDEAYQLSSGHFAQEAVDELVRLLTLDAYKGKLIVILAGYENDINHLMTVNSGLSSRFPDQIHFKNMDADHCLDVVKKELQKENVQLPNIDDPTSNLYRDMKEIIRDMAELNDWGNARDMMTLSKALINKALLNGGGASTSLTLSDNDTLDEISKMLRDRQRRSKVQQKARKKQNLPVQSATPNPPTPPPIDISTDTQTKAPQPPAPPSSPPSTPRVATPSGRAGTGGNRRRNVAKPSQPGPPSPSPSPSPSLGHVHPARGRGSPVGGRGRGGPNVQAKATQAKVTPPQAPLAPPANVMQRGNGALRARGRGGKGAQPNFQPHQSRPQASSSSHSQSPNGDPTKPDPGVSNEIWNQLLAAKAIQDDAPRKAAESIRQSELREATEKQREEKEKKAIEDLKEKEAAEKDAKKREEILKRQEEARLRVQAARRAREKAARELAEKQKVERQRQEREAKAQRKLREMGVCVAGFRWINNGDHYRCAGGTHVVSTAQLGL